LPLLFDYPELAPIAGLPSAPVGVTGETEEFYYLDATIDIKNHMRDARLLMAIITTHL